MGKTLFVLLISSLALACASDQRAAALSERADIDIQVADSALRSAKSSGAQQTAPALVSQAESYLRSALEKFQSGEFAGACRLARLAASTAEEARRKVAGNIGARHN